jgi:phosphoglycerate dehydrogenase-like enzyme
LAGAALDVLSNEPPAGPGGLLDRADVIVTPHMSWYSTQAERRLQQMVAEEARAVLMGEPARHPVRMSSSISAVGQAAKGGARG